MEEKVQENLLASVLGYTDWSKEIQCASKEREESSIKKKKERNIILCIFNPFLQGPQEMPITPHTSRLFFSFYYDGFLLIGFKGIYESALAHWKYTKRQAMPFKIKTPSNYPHLESCSSAQSVQSSWHWRKGFIGRNVCVSSKYTEH